MIKRKTKEYALKKCEFGSNHYVVDLDSYKNSRVFSQSSDLWKNLRYHTLTNAEQFNKIAQYCIKTGETDWMIVKKDLGV